MAVMFPEEMLCSCIICTQLRKYPPKEKQAMVKEESLAERIEDLDGEIEMLTRNLTTLKRKLEVAINALYLNGFIEHVYLGDTYVPEYGGNGFKPRYATGNEPEANPYEQMTLDDL